MSLSLIKRRLYLWVSAYFKWWASISLRRWSPTIIAITGSVGKTTMLHLIEQQLGSTAHYSHRANSSFGIAFDIVGLRGITDSRLRWLWLLVAVPFRALTYSHREKYYVVEADGERPGELEFVAKWLRPHVTLWISLGKSHAVYFDKKVADGTFVTIEEAILHEFSQLAAYTREHIIANGDEPSIRDALTALQTPAEFASLNELTDYQVWPNRSEFTMPGGVFSFGYPMPRETAMQLALLERLMYYLKQPIHYAMPQFTMPPGRSSYFAGIDSTHLIDSSYNAHLISMLSIIDMYDQMHTPHRKWLVLGDMFEMGSIEQEEHEALARRICESSANHVVLIGNRLKKYSLAILKQNAPPTMTVTWYPNPKDALPHITSAIEPNDTLLFKGSQYLEWLVEKLLANPADVSKLPRQEPAAKRRREKRGLV